MLHLDDSLFFAQGYTRKCFIHPDNENLCIKIPLFSEQERLKSIMKSIVRENKYLQSLENRNVNWDHISRYKGDVATNLGTGSVYHLIRDADGHISKSLDHYLQQLSTIKQYETELIKQLSNLYFYMHENKVLTTSLLPRNIVISNCDDKTTIYLIDDLGNSELLRISEFHPKLTKRKINRKWLKMIQLIREKHPKLSPSFYKNLSNIIIN